ncbi:hypothetical protein TNCV_2451951 [Trichonephila clavipes]|nr:hypothetical protein TNCV_2451951 [Trichonephila clavipes]
MVFVILNHSQVTRTTSELAPPLLTTTPTGGRLNLDIFCVHQPPLHDGTSTSNKVICERRDPFSLPESQNIIFLVPSPTFRRVKASPSRGQHLLSGIRAALLQLSFCPTSDGNGFLGSRGCGGGPKRTHINPPNHSYRMHV